MSSSKNLDTKTINKLKQVWLEHNDEPLTDQELNEILQNFTVQEIKIISNPPLDINKYRKDKGAQAISITQISIDTKNNLPSISNEWLVSYTDDKDLSGAIAKFFDSLSINSRDVSGNGEADRIYNKTTLISRSYQEISYQTYELSLGFKNKGNITGNITGKEYFCIRVYANALPDDKKYATDWVLQNLYK